MAPGLVARGALALIRAYKYLFSPWFTGACRFVPTCADYTAEAIARHGAIRGGWLGVRRLSRCHPFGSSGLDPVPLGLVGRVRQVGQVKVCPTSSTRTYQPDQPNPPDQP